MNKKLLLLVVCAIFAVGQINAQWGGKNYINVSWVNQTLENKDNGLKWKSDFGVSLVKGTTYYLHPNALWGMVKFGIDWTQLDLNYAKLKEQFEINPREQVSNEYLKELDVEDLNLGKHQLEYSMHVGPSVTVNPINLLKIHAYFRYAPSFSAVICDNEYGDTQFSGAFGNFFVTGAAVAYKFISLGVEYRWGSGKYKTYGYDASAVTDDLDTDDIITSTKSKMNTSSTRIFVSFRF